MKRTTQAFLSAALLAAGVSIAPAAMAQSATPSETPQQQAPQAAATPPSDAQLEKFAGASQKVAMVADEYRPQVQAASNDASREKLLKEADEKMVRAVNADGMTVDEFNGISQAIQQDPQLQQRVMAMVQQKQGGATGGMR